MIDFVCDDVLNWAKHYRGAKFHAALLDGPYHLNFMGKKWDASGPDAICFQPETWEALAEHLHDGAFIMAFSGARTYHRMACAIEDAGFVLHSMLAWSFGSGFPKATRIDTQIDKAAGAEREIVPYQYDTRKPNGTFTGGVYRDGDDAPHNHTAPATPLAATWQSHRYGLQALKPAMEPICIAQKPYSGRPVDCITQTGAGALNIDSARIGTNDTLARGMVKGTGTFSDALVNHGGRPETSHWKGHLYDSSENDNKGGRWPANFVLSHSYHPVMRLTGNLPYDIIEVIRRYYDGYTNLSAMRERSRNNNFQTERGPEVLQQAMQSGITTDKTNAEASNTEVSGMRERIPYSASMGETGTAEILQSGLFGPLQTEVNRDKIGSLWSETYGQNERQNFDDQKGEGCCSEQRESSSLEGRKNTSRGIYQCNDRHIAARATGDGVPNGRKSKVHSGTSTCNGDEAWATFTENGNGASYQWSERRQQTGELNGSGEVAAFTIASKDREGISDVEGGERTLEVLAKDVPTGWLRYFELTGENLGCCNGVCSDDCPVRLLGEQSGETPSNYRANKSIVEWDTSNGVYKGNIGKTTGVKQPDTTGTAARFFFNSDWQLDQQEAIDNAAPFYYCSKAPTSQRNAGLDERNTHPTLKNLKLTRYLASLLLPPSAYAPRRLLVPFAGVASEVIGGMMAGFEDIVGIEREQEYCTIAHKRIAYWQAQQAKQQPTLLEVA